MATRKTKVDKKVATKSLSAEVAPTNDALVSAIKRPVLTDIFHKMGMIETVGAQWIWIDGPSAPENVHALFRTRFTAPDGEVALLVSVAGNYAAYVNGSLAAFGQYTDYPSRKTYSRTDISHLVHRGAPNELVIWARHSGDAFTSHTDGAPGLWAVVLADGAPVVLSSPSWESRPDTRFAQGAREKLSVSLDWTWRFDARVTPPAWRPSVPAPRPFPPPVARPVPPVAAAPFAPLAELPFPGRHVFDAGEETTGFLECAFRAPAGTVVEIRHAEYLVGGELNPAAFQHGKCFCDTFVCAEGENAFSYPLRRYGGRYFEVRATKGAPLDVLRFGLRRTIIDLPTPPFACSDPLFEAAHAISARTLRLCLHEKYENCPWREQSICATDARNQMLFGYGFWGNYDRAAAMIDLFAQSVKPNGFIRAATPTARALWIPAFTFTWMSSIDEHALYSGTDAVFRRHAALLEEMLRKILASGDGALFFPPDDEVRWDYGECVTLEYAADPPNAFYNLLMREALLRLAPRFRASGRGAFADRLDAAAASIARNVEARFWDAHGGAYADHVEAATGRRAGFHAFVQALALAQGLVPAARRRALLDGLRDGRWGEVALPNMPYLVKAVFTQGDAADRQWLHGKIRALVRRHLDAGATTWWEDASGTAYAGGGGSLCHGWSAFEAWYETEYLLGAKPTGDGGVTIDPFRPEGLAWIRGTVFTPRGPREISVGEMADAHPLSEGSI